MQKEIMNEREVAHYLGRDEKTIRKLRKAGLIPCRTVPGVRSPFYSRSAIDRWVAGDATPTREKTETDEVACL